MTLKWTPTGGNWMAATWVGDTQVIYLVYLQHGVAGWWWWVERKVCGAANSTPVYLGLSADEDTAKQIAEEDEDDLQNKGF